MEQKIYDAYVRVLESELIKALGCTEPGTVAFTAAKTVSVLGTKPEHLAVNCSGNIVKNVKGVVVPNSGGLRGIAPAAILGALVAKPELELEILEAVTDDDRAEAKRMMDAGICTSTLEEGEGNLYVEVEATAGTDSAKVVVRNNHTNITLIEKNGEPLQSGAAQNDDADIAEMKKLMSVSGIIEFAKTCDLEDVKGMLDQQIECNNAIGEEGLKGGYGAEVGKTLIETYGDEDVLIRLKAMGAAGSDARMAGSVMPVVTNSGSGNQGITVTNPVTEFARGTGASEEQMYRALLISNLISVHIKSHIGPLSAFCGAVSASAGVSGALTYLSGGSDDQIGKAVVNVLGDAGGMVCDGAKASCAAKIATSLDAAVMGYKMAMNDRSYEGGEGIVEDDVEKTIQNVGYMGRVGMAGTDIEILHVMLGDRDVTQS